MQNNNKKHQQPRLRIGIDAKRAFNNGTGLGNYSRFVINGLVKMFPGHDYFLFTPTIKAEFEHFYPGTENIKLVTPESFWGRQFSSLWRTYAISDMCNSLKLDIFHGLSNELPVGIEQFTGRKIVTIHDLIFLRYPDYYHNIDRYIYTRKFKYACEKADIIIAVSEQTKKDIIHYFGTETDKIVIGYQDCNVLFSLPASNEEKIHIRKYYSLPDRYILCVGTIENRKNQLTVLKAFHQLNAPSFALIFIGKHTDYASRLLLYIKEHRLENQVLFLQQLPVAHLPAIYQMASAFVYASEFEGFGIPVLEGMRSGIPVIAANASSLPEVGGTAINYFEPKDIEGLTLSLKKALSEPFVAKAYDEQLRMFDPSRLIQQLEELYRLEGVYGEEAHS